MDLADPADLLAGDPGPGGAPRMQERLLPGRHLDLHSEALRKRFQNALQRIELGAHRGAAPVVRPEWAGRQAADPPRLIGGRGTVAGELPGEHALMVLAALAE